MSAPCDPTMPSVPISYPITDLEALLSRSYFDSFHYPFNISSVHLPAASVKMPHRQRMLVCHDFKGGYTDDDKWIQGGANAGAYAVWHWHLIDIFVYFSHNLVTLPPPGWINAAHTHGVKVLGTFITEWEKGREICNTLLSTVESARTYAERLAELANKLGFDGWLINMEVKLDPQQTINLKEFVSHLTQSIHNVVPGSLVIWYDSVTIDGDLKYQNQLNEKNKPFFDVSDGIFCNYCWKENFPEDSSTVAGDRRFDVYMGIDVWGRGTYGGGQWTTNVALDVLKKDDVSAAVFAPGWVYETGQGPDFQTAQNRWWRLVEQSWGVVQKYPKALPFYSDFNQGHGSNYFVGGFQVFCGPWNNMSYQGFQPILHCPDSSQSSMHVFKNFDDVPYCGGGCITCEGVLNCNDVFTTRLFLGQLTSDMPLILTYHVKSDGKSLMGLKLTLSSTKEGTEEALLLPDVALHPAQLINKFDSIILAQRASNQDSSLCSNWCQYESTIVLNDSTLTEVGLLCYLNNSDVVKNSTSHEATIDESTYKASLGRVHIRVAGVCTEFPPADKWFIDGKNISRIWKDEGTRTVSLTIRWGLDAGLASSSFVLYNIYVQKISGGEGNLGCNTSTPEFVGTARTAIYYISALEVPIGVSCLKFIIQVCAIDGTFMDLDKSPSYHLFVEGL
ncbi:hypothetical protein HPP92_006510 [Vanilla planifolia]|uniref:mannosyl-glycoprotein endo-beta-N-acetylglucosaminidase n=1 Tax=Vanilla planifolia TaxID=51239 RepID=A0A835RPG8_VANPL|nr:hypothetical protein HPP92_006510 [Vanilla planifolia]